MITIKAAPIQMTSDIPDSEIKMASLLCDHLSKIEGKINVSLEHLNGIYEPFKAVEQIPVEETIKNRVHLREFRDQVIDNFNNILAAAKGKDFLKILNHFSSDTQINELISSFEKSLNDIEKQVNLFLKLFSNLSAQDFKDRIILGIDNIKKQCSQLNQLINDRFINHMEENILKNNNMNAVAHFNKEKEILINKLASFNFKV